MQQPADMPPFSPAGWRGPAGAPSPISSRPPAPTPGQHQQQQQQQMEELGAAVSGSGSGSIDGHEGGLAGGEEGERGGSSSAGNRWPRQETLALLKIRSEMDAAFREAALKGPLWEEVSRKLAEMGHNRSAKKCREKFENVDKYYRRTKDGRTGRGDGKTYRFFTELEALHGAAASSPRPPTPVAAIAPPPTQAITAATSTIGAYSGAPTAATRVPAQPSLPASLLAPQPAQPMFTEAAACAMTTVADASFSDTDGEDSDETADGGKRKRRDGSAFGHGGKAMRFFEGLMQQVMERQEAMQHRLLEAIERRDQDRMIREEAWRRQEVARLAREQDALAQERAVAASRDAAVVSFIQRITGQMIVPVQAPPPSSYPAPAPTITSTKPPPLQPTPVATAAPAPQTPRPPVQSQPNVTPTKSQPQTPQPHQQVMPTTTEPQPQSQTPQTQSSKEIVVHSSEAAVDMAGSGFGGPSPSRWPKAEVHALIQLRTEMETRYQDTAPKGPLWEDISVGMRRLGYNRSSKRCKEKWENINKYFKKVKESSRKRPEDSKTCPYFHQLDALYRTKALASSSGAVHAPLPSPRAEAPAVTVLAPVPLSSQTPPAPQHVEHTKSFTNGNGNGCASQGHGASNGAGMQVKASNGAGAAATLPSVVGTGHVGNNGTATNKLEPKQDGIAKETTITEQPAVAMNHNYGGPGNGRRDEYDMDSDSMDDDEDDFDDDDEDDDDVAGRRGMPVQYDAHFLQRQQQQQQNHSHSHNVVRPNTANGGGNPPAGNAAPAAAATSGAPFLAMVQ